MSWLRAVQSDVYESSEEHLRDELHRVGGLVRAQLLRFRFSCPEAQRERFWHLPDDDLVDLARDSEHSPIDRFGSAPDVGEILEWVESRQAVIESRLAAGGGTDLRLLRLMDEFGLSRGETDTLLLALLPSLHSDYRRWYGILQYDPAKVLATVGLLTEMLSLSGNDFPERMAAFAPDGRLVGEGLIALGGSEEEPISLRSVQVEDRIVAFLFGNDDMDRRLVPFARWFDQPVDLRSLPVPLETRNRLEMLPNLRAGEPEFLPRLRLEFLGPDPELAARCVAAVAAGLGRRLFLVDLTLAPETGRGWRWVFDCVMREARLDGAVLMLVGIGARLEEGGRGPGVRHWLKHLERFPHPAAVEVGSATGEEGRAGTGWIPFSLGLPDAVLRQRLWSALLSSRRHRIDNVAAAATDLANAFQLTDTQIRDAWRGAEDLARRRNVFLGLIERDDLFAACRRQSTRRLVAFAERIEPRRDLELERDLILPDAHKRVLFELRSRVRNHLRVHQVMNLGAHMRLGHGVTALFVGGSGTGKTLAAEVLASEQRVDLYRIDLAALVSKWVGETEKNLSRIFADAEQANCMLFFDEADSMFGHRGEVKEARDRWANLEVNYLLQRIESYSGVVILATNLAQNIDDAFKRRINVVVEFPMPDAASRRKLWERLLPAESRDALGDSEIADLSERFELTGGNIRNVVLDACYRALDSEEANITARHLIAGTAREYQKIQRPVTRGEFGARFYDWAMDDIIAPRTGDPAGEV